uniref:Centrosomal protein 43 n=1 Tax=Mola mola TaxID=94237 RepID=A0A3Q4BRN7_MOLML
MRAAVFLAMEDQDKLENKTPLVNENLKKCLNTKDGRLVASLVLDFLQVFHLDFTLAVFQPEINSLSGLEGRDAVCRELSLSPLELNSNCPLLLQLVRRGQRRASEEPSQKQIEHARRKFDFYDKDGSGSVLTDDLKRVFTDLFPGLNKNMLETFLSDELRAADRTFSRTVDVQLFVKLYKRLFADCLTVVRLLFTSRRHLQANDSGSVDFQQQVCGHSKASSSALKKDCLDLDLEGVPDDGDSFFDDPLPKPQKTYGW